MASLNWLKQAFSQAKVVSHELIMTSKYDHVNKGDGEGKEGGLKA